MQLPTAQYAVVSAEKLRDYLLCPAHPDNGGKAVFFESLGFTVENWSALEGLLRQLAVRPERMERVTSPYGVKYVIDGWLQGFQNQRGFVRTVWIVDRGSSTPRLVTAYPAQSP